MVTAAPTPNTPAGTGPLGNPAGALAPLEMLGFAMGLFDGDGCEDDWAELTPDFDEELADSGSLLAHPAMAIETVVTTTTAPAIVLLRKAKAI
ncbi:hypothetical protein CacPP4_03560 [Cutibacterium acnes subsp. acnes]|uniref:Uncharacterized protein n=2 Tax=Cutibacterium acnes TaxID=1747 RepID=A0ABM7GWM3_CUTAC|nr:hypothetical protein CacPP4_03560 [Cutibacterium acnes subsp. acnes]BDE66686.1 hypothetical protein TPCU411_02910 [Cutibacterium acnes]